MTCSICRKIQADGFRPACPGIEKVDECPRGEVFKLSKENQDLWVIFEHIFPGLKSGAKFDEYDMFCRMAGCWLIDFYLGAYEVPEKQRPEARRRLMRMIPRIIRKQNG